MYTSELFAVLKGVLLNPITIVVMVCFVLFIRLVNYVAHYTHTVKAKKPKKQPKQPVRSPKSAVPKPEPENTNESVAEHTDNHKIEDKIRYSSAR